MAIHVGRQALLQARDEITERERRRDVDEERRPGPLIGAHGQCFCERRAGNRADAAAREDRGELLTVCWIALHDVQACHRATLRAAEPT